ncbi:MAG: SMC family ATPase, partial [Parasporobacterium sp.]|nr:SMC family ATPase [Parasporobacterium sp.]
KTEKYYKLQERLKEETKALSADRDRLQENIKQYIKGIVCDEDNPLFPETEKARAESLTTEDTLELLNKLIAEDEALENDFTEQNAALQKQLDVIKERLIKAEAAAQAANALKENEEKAAECADLKKQLTEKCEEEKSRQPEADAAKQKAAEIKTRLPEYDELQEKQGLLAKNEKIIEGNARRLATIDTEIKQLSEESDALSEELKTLAHAGEDKLRLETEKNGRQQEAERIAALRKSLKELSAADKKYRDAREAYRDRETEKEAADSIFRHKEKLYLDAQAGILAENLEADMPCPVCGSKDHPKLAVKPETAPTEDEIEELRTQAADAATEASKASAEAGKLKGIFETSEAAVKGEIAACLGDVDLENADFEAQNKLAEIRKDISELDDSIQAEDNKLNRKKAIEKALPEKTEQLESIKKSQADIQKDSDAKAAENKSLSERLSELAAKLSYKTKAEADAAAAAFNAKAAEIVKAFETAKENLNICDKDMAALEAQKKELTKQLADAPEVDVAAETAAKEALEEQQRQLTEQGKAVNSRLTANKNSLVNIETKSGELIATEKKFTWVNALTATANGTVNGKDKVMLETYIQMEYFDRIISRANSRLRIMTGDQYELVRRKDAASQQSQSGLDLDVIDHYNATERSVKSLSGGESFKASLALALGLSDEIQSSAGGIKLDTMFVDEGFGSLDDESLNQAMKALTTLADGSRLVGIISHVNELKQRIDKQIVVTKEKSGGSRAEIVV